MMGLDTLRYIDLYAPVVKDVNLSYNYESYTSSPTNKKGIHYLGASYDHEILESKNEPSDYVPSKLI